MKKIALAFILLLCILCGCDNMKNEENKCLYNEMYWGESLKNIINKNGEPNKCMYNDENWGNSVKKLVGKTKSFNQCNYNYMEWDGLENNNAIQYKEIFFERDCDVTYIFDNEKLTDGLTDIYIYTKSKDDYEFIKGKLNEKYGQFLEVEKDYEYTKKVGNTNIDLTDMSDEFGFCIISYSMVENKEF